MIIYDVKNQSLLTKHSPISIISYFSQALLRVPKLFAAIHLSEDQL